MRRLAQGQEVTIDLEGEAEGVQCRVSAVQSPLAVLTQSGDSAPRVLGRLAAGSIGYMMFEDAGALVGLRGAAKSDPGRPLIHFVSLDVVELPERREQERLALTTTARLTPIDAHGTAGEPVVTETINLSLTGVLLKRPGRLASAHRFELRLFLENDPSPLQLQARLARLTPTQIALQFDEMDVVDRARLAAFLGSER